MPSLAHSIDLFDEARDDDANDAILASLDPLDPRRVSLDIFEVYCHEMVMTSSVGRRAYLIDKMRVSLCLVSCVSVMHIFHLQLIHSYPPQPNINPSIFTRKINHST